MVVKPATFPYLKRKDIKSCRYDQKWSTSLYYHTVNFVYEKKDLYIRTIMNLYGLPLNFIKQLKGRKNE
jgi:hypothetical protein